MGNATGTQAGSQAGQQGSGSQAGQGGTESQGQQGQGSQAGQTQQQQQEAKVYPGMLSGESLDDYVERITGALSTARKQAATYRTRLSASGMSTDDNEDSQQGGSGSQAGQGQQRNQQGGNKGENDRIARLERALQEERQARVQERTTSQLMSALAREGALNPERAIRLIDTSVLNVGDDGTVDDPLGAVRELKASDPYLFGDTRGSGDGGAGNGSEAATDFNTMIRNRAAGKR